MELGDTSDEEASPQRPKKREMLKSQQIQMVTTLQTLETDNGMRSGAFTMVAKCFSVARSTVHHLWNRVVRMCAHGHNISPEFQSHKKIAGDLLFIHWSSSARECRTSHYASDGPKESWWHRWGCQRRRCNVGLLIQLFEFIETL